jgi:hypothetical protein
MTDRELIELAAKAIGIQLKWSADPDLSPRRADNWEIWNPLHNAGDAGWLEAKLRMDTRNGTSTVTASRGKLIAVETVNDNQDRGAATRRARVRVAAELGKRGTTREENLALVARLRAEKAKP